MENSLRLSRVKKYTGKILHIYQDEIKLPNEGIAIRELIEHVGAAMVLPIIDNKIFFVKQYRHPVEQYLLELPAGVLNKNEDPKICAMRELEEEEKKLCQVFTSHKKNNK